MSLSQHLAHFLSRIVMYGLTVLVLSKLPTRIIISQPLFRSTRTCTTDCIADGN